VNCDDLKTFRQRHRFEPLRGVGQPSGGAHVIERSMNPSADDFVGIGTKT
jgi:hypothetical protein